MIKQSLWVLDIATEDKDDEISDFVSFTRVADTSFLLTQDSVKHPTVYYGFFIGLDKSLVHNRFIVGRMTQFEGGDFQNGFGQTKWFD